MTLAPSPYPDHADLRPAIISKGLKTFHLAAEDGSAGCGKKLDRRAVVGTFNKRGALRRGLTLCANCANLELEELAE